MNEEYLQAKFGSHVSSKLEKDLKEQDIAQAIKNPTTGRTVLCLACLE
jgi:hypothetical protein